jgi:hypothetical protein
MFIPRASDKKEHDENHKALFCPSEDKNGEKPFHLRA